ncbi:Uncharacterised protein [Legionella cincinnatiensis]|uniref:Uncharacterized protein n=2 Tax=Legionella cincinnatiensis TaxID=28085 RepID=A0A378IER2_9GAMM|nr:hypothetical protein Lcin_0951 [Legionella cincinnatiensis]STX33523.1 Uncharacterised protein [Legionella cincinnatiensis]
MLRRIISRPLTKFSVFTPRTIGRTMTTSLYDTLFGNKAQIFWKETEHKSYKYKATVHNEEITMKMNPEFPEVPLYTIRQKEGKIIGSVDAWPDNWIEHTSTPKL